MKILSINNYPVVKKTNSDITAQHKNSQAPSFKSVIIDERGVKELSKPLSDSVLNSLNGFKALLKKESSQLVESKEHDMLVYPFRNIYGSDGVAVFHAEGESASCAYFYSHENLSSENVLKWVKRHLHVSTPFVKSADKKAFPDYLWKIEKPLPEAAIKNRFSA